MIKYAKVTWIVLSVTVLITTLIYFDAQANSDAETILLWGMLVLSFPISLLCALIISTFNYILFHVMGLVVTTSVVTMVSVWIVYFALGLWQWFSLIPEVIKRNRRENPGKKL
ncbi:MAG: hypothetical protein JAY95_00700 [Candidatus Thiodiazotropha taylori]|nr:hypothetical protein [Candidatus Thiodiazotropha taylori]